MKSLETWGNLWPNILKCARTTFIAPADMDEGEAEAWKEAQLENDKIEERYRGVQEHEAMPGTKLNEDDAGVAWTSKVVGDS